jgi:hypothetical protein
MVIILTPWVNLMNQIPVVFFDEKLDQVQLGIKMINWHFAAFIICIINCSFVSFILFGTFESKFVKKIG